MSPEALLRFLGELASPIAGLVEAGTADEYDAEAERLATLRLTRALADARARRVLETDDTPPG